MVNIIYTKANSKGCKMVVQLNVSAIEPSTCHQNWIVFIKSPFCFFTLIEDFWLLKQLWKGNTLLHIVPFCEGKNKKPEGFAKQKQPAIFAMWHASQLVVHQPSLIYNVP